MGLKKVNEALNTYVRPQTFPVAYKLVRADEDLPERVRRPLQDLGHPIALCQATALTRRYGWTLAVGREDQCCIGGERAMGFASEGGAGPVAKERMDGLFQ